MPESSIEALQAALTGTRQLVGGVRPEQWTHPTPCPDWTVADLTAHVVHGNAMFAAILRGQAIPTSAGAGGDIGRLHGDQVPAYDAAAAQLLDAFSADGALDRVVTLPFGTVPGAVAQHLRITELLVHGWDLAQATGQRLVVPEYVAEQELAFSRTAVPQLPPGRSPFGPPQSAPADASALERLAALLGRPVDR